jgi:hypothetical protein
MADWLPQVEVCTWQMTSPAAGAEHSAAHAATAASEDNNQQQQPHGGPLVWLQPHTAVALGLPQLLESTRAQGQAKTLQQHQSTKQTSASTSAPNASEASEAAAAAGCAGLLDWGLLQQLLDAGQWSSAGSLHLLAGGSDALLPAKYDVSDR